jgi:cytohesin
MKHLLLTTIAAVLLVGCFWPSVPDISIHVAVKSGNIEAVKQHLAAGTDVNAKSEVYGWTPLFYAASGGGQKEIAELLIAEGADTNAKDKLGDTPLQVAAYQAHKEIAELFIANGADVYAKADNGKTPLDWADGETYDLFRKHGGKTGEELKGGEPVVEATQPELPTAEAPDISIHEAAIEGDIEAVKQFIAAGTDVNAKNPLSGTPLHLAARYDFKEISELLIDKGADLNAKDNIGWTPLHFATVLDHKEIVELLIAAGADVNAKNKEGRTPLNWAINLEETETADLLRKHGGKTGAELKAEGK